MSTIFLDIVNRSISASWLILAVLLFRILLKKAPRWIHVLLWGIVALRLLCPFSLESTWSLIPSARTIPANIAMSPAPAIDSGISALDGVVNPIVHTSFTPSPGASVNPLQVYIPVAALFWCLGMAGMLLFSAAGYFRLTRKIRTAIRLEGNIYRSEYIPAPFVLGIVRPRIYLPCSMDEGYTAHVIAHEQTHIRRKDHLWKPLGFLLLSLHWFNPLMWLAYALLCRDIELACDEKVIAAMTPDGRADYSQALVACSMKHPALSACPLAFGETHVKARLRSILRYKKPTLSILLLAALCCVTAAVCFLTDPKQRPAREELAPASTPECWFDFLHTSYPKETLTIELEAYPGVTFQYNGTQITASRPFGDSQLTGHTILIEGLPIYNAFFADLTGDGYPEIFTTCAFGFGMIDNRVVVCDYVNGTNYTLSDRGYFDFTLRQDGQDGLLYVDKSKYNSNELVETGRLVFKDNCIQIEGFSNEANSVFQAEILEVHNGYYLVKPVEGSWELNSADRIEVSIRNAHPSPEPEIGDVIEIEYSGEILETYPARITDIYGIKIIKKAETWDLIPMVMVNGTLYFDTGHESRIEARCGVMDGEITSQVDGNKQPSIDDQSNFGIGYGYQYGATEGTIELFMNGKWWIFATEEARQKIPFTSIEDEPSKFYLTIGKEGVQSITLECGDASGGCQHADGSPFREGECVHLEFLDGYRDLRGLTITALDANGNTLWSASVPDTETNRGFTRLVSDNWLITNIP